MIFFHVNLSDKMQQQVTKCHCGKPATYFCPGDDEDCEEPLCEKCGTECFNEKCKTKYCDGLNCHTLKHCEEPGCIYKACGDLIESNQANEQCGIHYIVDSEENGRFFCYRHYEKYQ